MVKKQLLVLQDKIS